MRKIITEKIKRSIKRLEKAERERICLITQLQINCYSWFKGEYPDQTLTEFLKTNKFVQGIENSISGFLTPTKEALKIVGQDAQSKQK